MTAYIIFILGGILDFFSFALIVSAILSWLVLFNVVNPYNPTMRQIMGLVNMVTEPILIPFRKVIPPLGMMDISFLVAYLAIKGMRIYLLPMAGNALFGLIG